MSGTTEAVARVKIDALLKDAGGRDERASRATTGRLQALAGTRPTCAIAPLLRGHQDVDGLFAGRVGAPFDLVWRTATQRVVQNDERVIRYAHHPGNVAGRDLERGGA